VQLPFRMTELVRLVPVPATWRAWWKALLPPSLVIAGSSCVLGIVLATRDGRFSPWPALVTLAAGVLLQSGVNLVNDFFESRHGPARVPLAAQFAGLVLSWFRGWPLLAIGFAGFVGGYAYTGEPLNYKRRGLGVPLVFFLMGVQMIAGARLAVTGDLTADSVLRSIPISGMVSLILLANELRDHETDARRGIRTLTVRIGCRPARVLYF